MPSTPAGRLRLQSYALLAGSALAFVLGLAYLFGGLVFLGPPSESDDGWMVTLARLVAEDQHYKYLVPLLVPVGSYFVIANWISWEFFRYA